MTKAALTVWSMIGWRELAVASCGVLVAVLAFVSKDLYEGRQHNERAISLINSRLYGIEATQILEQTQRNQMFMELQMIRQSINDHANATRSERWRQ